MSTVVIGAKEARIRFRDVLEAAHAGTDTVIERNGRPAAVVIPYPDYEAILEALEDIRADRRAVEAYEEWKRDPSTARPFAEFEAELIAEGLLDE